MDVRWTSIPTLFVSHWAFFPAEAGVIRGELIGYEDSHL